MWYPSQLCHSTGEKESLKRSSTRRMEGMAYYKAKQCFLEVRVTNEAAISLYKKLGFEVTRTLNGYYSDGEDAYVMTKRL